ncbi:hypothetical protein LIER_31310 [Lithospermum erythrorhizon]|uniref:Uncharacterized protein n=1 Tax=Lithospermum erythrorhizon TaxID=34254 RepID=A0AAV3RQJ9_LITER
MSDVVPKSWTSLAEALHPKFKKIALVIAQISTLKRVFVNLFHYKVFCDEGVLIQVGLIRSKEFEPTMAPPVSWGNVVQPAPTPASVSLSEKRPAPTEGRPKPLFSKRQKSIAHKPPKSDILDLTVDPPSFTIPDREAPKDAPCLEPSTSESMPDN